MPENLLMFDPKVKIKENIAVFVDKTWKYLEVEYIEPLPPSKDLIKDFGAITAGSSSGDTVVDSLEMETDEVGQFRFYPLDDIQIEVKQPKSMTRFSNKNTRVRVDQYTATVDPELKSTELFVSEDDYPYMDIENPTQYDLTQSRVMFFGYRIVGRQLADEPDRTSWVVGQGY